ncbi:MAG: TonB-dependent receptor [Acidobacteriota bacterium]|nr:TonB-dependent receptor [Acidobacteriota bacterium]
MAYLDSEILEFIGNCPAGLFFPPPPESLPVGCPAPSSFGNVLTFDASGNRLDNAPEWQIASTLSYTWSVGTSHFMNLAADVSYKDDNEGSGAAPTGLSLFYIPDYTIVNMRIGFGDVLGRWDVEVWGRNVTDED